MPETGVRAKSASKGKDGMAETLVERIWAWLHATFPERQIYVRSEGRVQFFTFGPTLQATLSGLALIFLGWVAFATVNVIFKDRIIASKDHRYQQMRWADENRIADLQQSYDELNGALVSAEDRFKSKADELEAKQETVSRLLNRKQAVDSIVAGLRGSSPEAARQCTVGRHGADRPRQRSRSPERQRGIGHRRRRIGGGSQLAPMPQNSEPQPRTSRPTKASFLDEAVSRFAATFFHAQQSSTAHKVPNLPALRVLAAETDRISRLSGAETALLVGVDKEVSTRIADLQTILHRVGVDSNSLEQQASEGMGGPYIPVAGDADSTASPTTPSRQPMSARAHTRKSSTRSSRRSITCR